MKLQWSFILNGKKKKGTKSDEATMVVYIKMNGGVDDEANTKSLNR